MRQLRLALLFGICSLCSARSAELSLFQTSTTAVNWADELKKAQAGIEKNPKSSFWHNQAGVAYNALGDIDNAEKELILASELDSTNPIDYYTLYAFYKQRGKPDKGRDALLSALENDSANPFGHFELGALLEKEGHVKESVTEYRKAKILVSKLKGREYVDPRGNPYKIEYIRREVDKCIDRVAKLKASKEGGK